MRILFVAYFFPPTQAVGVVRIAKFAKYWRAAGADVEVLTSDDILRRANRSDRDLERDVEGVPLTVARTLLRPRLLARLRAGAAGATSGDPSPAGARSPGAPARSTAEAGRDRLGRGVVSVARRLRDHVLLPDVAIGWAPSAYRAALRAHRERPFDLVFASGNPWSNLIAASWIARRLGVPLAIDFRDPWADGPLFDWLPAWTRFERGAHEALEAMVCRRAAVITTTTRPIGDKLAARCAPCVAPVVIENGYDPADAEVAPAKDPGVFRVVMTSQFRAGDRFRTFVGALARCLARGLPPGRRVVLSFAGLARPDGAPRSIGDYFAEQGLLPHLEDRGYVSRRDALALQRSADLCLFVEHEFANVAGGMVGTEFYEYLGTGARILLLDDQESAVWHVGAPAGTVRRCARDDAPGIEGALADAMSGAWEPSPDWAWIHRFSRAGQAARMLELFAAALGEPGAGAAAGEPGAGAGAGEGAGAR